MPTEIKFEIAKTFGTLSESTKDWKKELNLISWNDKELKSISVIGMANMSKWAKA